jgi:hypothetical protein
MVFRLTQFVHCCHRLSVRLNQSLDIMTCFLYSHNLYYEIYCMYCYCLIYVGYLTTQC